MILEKFGGSVPDTMEELLQLPGVARKTANVVLGVRVRKSGRIVVDTHVFRVFQADGSDACRHARADRARSHADHAPAPMDLLFPPNDSSRPEYLQSPQTPLPCLPRGKICFRKTKPCRPRRKHERHMTPSEAVPRGFHVLGQADRSGLQSGLQVLFLPGKGEALPGQIEDFSVGDAGRCAGGLYSPVHRIPACPRSSRFAWQAREKISGQEFATYCRAGYRFGS